MPAVVWTDASEVESTSGDTDLSARWKKIGPVVLDVLSDWTQCDGVILRTEASNAQYLLLEGYKLRDDLQHAVPEKKSLRFWNGNAFNTCFVQHYEDGSLAALSGREQESFSEHEERFLTAVHWRGSFPIVINEGHQRLAILVSFETDRPAWLTREQMSISWMAAQLTVDKEARSNDADGASGSFVQASRNLSTLIELESRENKLSALLRILSSGRGLGWHRVWLFKRDGASLSCQTCCGGVTLEEWGNGAAFASSNLIDLTDEIAHDVIEQPRQYDSLNQVCVLDNAFVVEQDWFDLGIQGNLEELLFLTPMELTNSDGHVNWLSCLNSLATSRSLAFESDERTFHCSFRLDGDEYLAVMTWSGGQSVEAAPRIVETGAILAVASELSSAQSVGDPEQDETSELLRGMLSWLGVPSVSREEFERAKIRRARLRFEQSDEYRRQLGDQMAAAKARRDQDDLARGRDG